MRTRLLVCDTCRAVLAAARESPLDMMPTRGRHFAELPEGGHEEHTESTVYVCEGQPHPRATPAELIEWGQEQVRRGTLAPVKPGARLVQPRIIGGGPPPR